MIGFYDYTVILTYISFASAMAGIFTSTKSLRWSIFFLALCGLCDMFDGTIARTKKNRTEDEKSFGIQIDSLCDMVCFGVFPIIICYRLGMNHIYSMVILTLYGLAGLIRLAFFNVTETKRQSETDEDKTYYRGLPITSIAIALPLIFVVSPLFPSHEVFLAVLHVLMAVIGVLFVVDFKMRKLTAKELGVLVGVVALAVVVIVFIWHWWWGIWKKVKI
jgi:CDP-diacylglycerol--serine O-phosphatidyltransferase